MAQREASPWIRGLSGQEPPDDGAPIDEVFEQQRSEDESFLRAGPLIEEGRESRRSVGSTAELIGSSNRQLIIRREIP